MNVSKSLRTMNVLCYVQSLWSCCLAALTEKTPCYTGDCVHNITQFLSVCGPSLGWITSSSKGLFEMHQDVVFGQDPKFHTFATWSMIILSSYPVWCCVIISRFVTWLDKGAVQISTSVFLLCLWCLSFPSVFVVVFLVPWCRGLMTDGLSCCQHSCKFVRPWTGGVWHKSLKHLLCRHNRKNNNQTGACQIYRKRGNCSVDQLTASIYALWKSNQWSEEQKEKREREGSQLCLGRSGLALSESLHL